MKKTLLLTVIFAFGLIVFGPSGTKTNKGR